MRHQRFSAPRQTPPWTYVTVGGTLSVLIAATGFTQAVNHHAARAAALVALCAAAMLISTRRHATAVRREDEALSTMPRQRRAVEDQPGYLSDK